MVGSFFLTKESVGTVGLTYGDVFTFDSDGQIISAQNNYFDSQKAGFQKDYNQTCSDTLWDDLNMAIPQIMPLVKKLADPKNREKVLISALELELKKRFIQINPGFLIAFKRWLGGVGVQDIIMTTDGIEDGIQISDQNEHRWLLIDYLSIISHILLFQKLPLIPLKPDDLLCLAVRYLRTVGGTEFDNP